MSENEQAAVSAEVCGRCGVVLTFSFSRKFGLCMECSVCREPCCQVIKTATTTPPNPSAVEAAGLEETR